MLPNVTLKGVLSTNRKPQDKFIADLGLVSALVTQAQASGFKVVIVGGVWDLVHKGHADYLQLAKEEGDILIVVVDSDELVRSRKGPTRPVVPEEERIHMVCHLASTDIVIRRDLQPHLEDKEYLNKLLHPDVCVLSTSTGDIPEAQRAVIAQYVKEVKVFPPQAETSSSARIRLLAIDGATPLAKSVTELVNAKALLIAELLGELPQELQVLIDGHLQQLKGM